MAGEDSRAPGEIETGFELERFEFVTGTGMHALVRVRGRWTEGLDPAAGAPQLVADLAGRRQRFAPLDPREAVTFDPAGAAPWRSAYAVPAALLERPDVAYAIDGPGGLTGLPAPGERAGGRQLADLPGALAELRAAAERATAERDAAREALRETEERLDEASRRADSLAAQVQEDALELEQARAGVAAANAELADARELVERLQRELELARR